MECSEVKELINQLMNRRLSPLGFIELAGEHIFGTGEKPGCQKCIDLLDTLSVESKRHSSSWEAIENLKRMIREADDMKRRLDKILWRKK